MGAAWEISRVLSLLGGRATSHDEDDYGMINDLLAFIDADDLVEEHHLNQPSSNNYAVEERTPPPQSSKGAGLIRAELQRVAPDASLSELDGNEDKYSTDRTIHGGWMSSMFRSHARSNEYIAEHHADFDSNRYIKRELEPIITRGRGRVIVASGDFTNFVDSIVNFVDASRRVEPSNSITRSEMKCNDQDAMEQQATKTRIKSILKASSEAELIKPTWESNKDSVKQGNRADGGQDENPVEEPITGRESPAIRKNQSMLILRQELSTLESFKVVLESKTKQCEQPSEGGQPEERSCENQDTRGRRASELRNKKRSIEKLHGIPGRSQLKSVRAMLENEDQAEHNTFEARRQPEEQSYRRAREN